MSGSFPQAARKHVLARLNIHRAELVEGWKLVEEHKVLKKIDPLT